MLINKMSPLPSFLDPPLTHVVSNASVVRGHSFSAVGSNHHATSSIVYIQHEILPSCFEKSLGIST